MQDKPESDSRVLESVELLAHFLNSTSVARGLYRIGEGWFILITLGLAHNLQEKLI